MERCSYLKVPLGVHRCWYVLRWASSRRWRPLGWQNKMVRLENRTFLISVREIISMQAERRSNEESSVRRLQSRFPITSCNGEPVGMERVGWASTLSFQREERHVGVGYCVITTCMFTHGNVKGKEVVGGREVGLLVCLVLVVIFTNETYTRVDKTLCLVLIWVVYSVKIIKIYYNSARLILWNKYKK